VHLSPPDFLPRQHGLPPLLYEVQFCPSKNKRFTKMNALLTGFSILYKFSTVINAQYGWAEKELLHQFKSIKTLPVGKIGKVS
jgi:hypothetical protein